MSQGNQIFNEMQFNDAAYAQHTIEVSKAKLEKTRLGLIIGAVATVLALSALVASKNEMVELSDTLFVFGMIGSIVSYVMGGGFRDAVGMALKLAKWGWFVCPIFPIDLFVFLTVLIFGIYAFLFVPVLFIWLNRIQLKKDIEEAEEYLRYCTVPQNNGAWEQVGGESAGGASFCTNCGSPIKAGTAFCSNCGTKIG